MLDTDVVIAALDRADAHHAAAAAAIRQMIADEVELAISTINYAEALVRPAEDDATLRAAVDALAALGIRPLAPSAAVAPRRGAPSRVEHQPGGCVWVGDRPQPIGGGGVV